MATDKIGEKDQKNGEKNRKKKKKKKKMQLFLC
jgi:hypothetical protein